MSQDDYLIYGFHEVPKGLVLVVEWFSHYRWWKRDARVNDKWRMA